MSEDQPTDSIAYSEKALASMQHRLSKLKPIEPGDVCCQCGLDCDGDGFVIGGLHAHRVNGHPLCSRCYRYQWHEFRGTRSGCNCKRMEQKAKPA